MTSDQDVAVAPGGQRRDSILRNRDFVKLWAGETVSLVGTQSPCSRCPSSRF